MHPPKDIEGYISLLSIMPYADDDPIDLNIMDFNLEYLSNISISSNVESVKINHSEKQTFELSIRWSFPKIETETRLPVDIVFVIEKSMNIDKKLFANITQAINDFVEDLGDNDRVSIVVFDDFGYRSLPLVRITDENQDKIRETLFNLYLSGGADLSDGFG